MADAKTIGAVLDAAGLELLYHLGDVVGHGTQLGVGHQATRTEHAAKTADLAHLIGSGDGGVKIEVAGIDHVGQLLSTDDVSTCLLSLAGLLALGEDGDTDTLARAVRQGDGAANLLICLAGVDAQAEVGLDRLVKGGGVDVLDQGGSVHWCVELASLDLCRCLAILLAVLCHVSSSLW